MKLDDLINQTSEWIKGTGPEPEIVMSSRIRFARNLEKIPFSHWAGKKEKEGVLASIKSVLEKIDYLKNSLYLEMKDLSAVDKQFLVERHLISRELAAESDSKAVDISQKEIFACMINEEDHLRIQVIQSGLNLEAVLRLIEKLDSALSDKLKFAYDARWGYLTACPTNVGSGMRGSVMLHLPALVMTQQINKVIQTISKLNLAVRGLYGEGTEASGNFFQISNQATLGYSEQDLVDNLNRVIRQIIGYEKKAREALSLERKTEVEDKIWRAYGTLSNTRTISSKETIELLSLVKLGVNIGILDKIDSKTVNELFIIIQPAHLQKIEGKSLDANQRDIKRAELLRNKLKF
jgi:protein arginine kinase